MSPFSSGRRRCQEKSGPRRIQGHPVSSRGNRSSRTLRPQEIWGTPQDPPAGFGHYVTLWRKQPDGNWKLALDIGIGHERSPKPAKVDSPPLAKDVAAPQQSSTVDSNSKAIAAADRAAAPSLSNQ